jgi:hypothetical protein
MAFKLIESAQQRWRAVSAPTWSPSSAPVPGSKTANSSSAPTTKRLMRDLMGLADQLVGLG